MRTTLRERVERRLIADPATGCLLWQGCLNSQGYGVISVSAKRQLVHRVVWELDNGPVPDGLPVDHVYDAGCRHKHCANIAHLEPVTHAENNRRRLNAMWNPEVRAYNWRTRPGPRPQPRNDPSPEYLAMLNAWLGDGT